MKQHVTRTSARVAVALLLAAATCVALFLSGCGDSKSSEPKSFGSSHSSLVSTTTSSEATSDAPASEVTSTTPPSEATSAAAPSESVPASEAPSTEAPSATSATPSTSRGSQGMLEKADDYYQDLKRFVNEELEDRANSEPQHVSIGEEAVATENLAVRVISVEQGPYDYEDDSPTVKVTVQMRNTSSHAVLVKASNWDADNTYGLRVDHKLWVKDENGNRVEESFAPVRISPGATYTGVVFFDGEDLVSVIYEPHWLISAENQYIYIDL